MRTQAITACAFIHNKGRLFAPRRAQTKAFLPDNYELPGGHIEWGEDIVVGLKRELKEEFGIDVVIGSPFYAFTYIDNSRNVHTVEVVYLVVLKDPDKKIEINTDEHSEYKWVYQDEALQLWKENDREREAVIRGFEIIY